MSIDVRVAHINVHQPAIWRKRKFNIDGVVAYVRAGGVGTLNEFGKETDHRYVKSLPGIGSYIYGELAILWDKDRFELVESHRYRIMVGGHVGADGTRRGPDNRRVGPSRWLIVAVLRDKRTGYTFIVATTHLVARAFTAHRWRQGILKASVNLAGLRLANLSKKYPNGILTGDMNWIGPRINWPHLAEVQLPLLKTHGNQKYDRAYVWGAVRLVPGTMKTFVRMSDHKGFRFTARIGGEPTPGVPPKSETGSGVVNKDPRPVPRPWRRRSKRWKRRHPKLWAQIVAWRKRHPLKNPPRR